MAIRTVRCHVLQANVTLLTDLEGDITRVICPEFDAAEGICRLKRTASTSGPLAALLLRVSEDTLGTRNVRCHYAA